jgi:histidine ammonia-lyase
VGAHITGDWRRRVARAARTVARVVESGATVYGVNTGFGLLAREAISATRLGELQVRLVRSHQAGVGPPLAAPAVRLALALKANALARGHSGVRVELIELLLAMLAREVLPVIPAKGSVGASGDLAPLAHLSAVLIGEGRATFEGKSLSGAVALKRAGLAPLVLAPKEGLALLNGTQISTALALVGLFAAERVFGAALLAGALSVDAVKGSDTPFDARIQALRGHRGQIDVAAALRALLAGSRIRESHVDCERVQDPYSLRCQTQVMGACLDQIRHAAGILAREANAVSDNPLVFPETGEVLPGCNLHAEPVAMAADQIAIALAEVGTLSERRTALLVDPVMSRLPAFLAPEPGIDSGFMIAQVTAAALASENKGLAHPSSIDSLPTSANQEDHVSMATHAARRLGEMADNAAAIVAIELLAGARALEFHAPLWTSRALSRLHRRLRAASPPYTEDRALAPDIEAVAALVATGALHEAVLPAIEGESG